MIVLKEKFGELFNSVLLFKERKKENQKQKEGIEVPQEKKNEMRKKKKNPKREWFDVLF